MRHSQRDSGTDRRLTQRQAQRDADRVPQPDCCAPRDGVFEPVTPIWVRAFRAAADRIEKGKVDEAATWLDGASGECIAEFRVRGINPCSEMANQISCCQPNFSVASSGPDAGRKPLERVPMSISGLPLESNPPRVPSVRRTPSIPGLRPRHHWPTAEGPTAESRNARRKGSRDPSRRGRRPRDSEPVFRAGERGTSCGLAWRG